MAGGKIQMPVKGVDGNTLDFFKKGGSTIQVEFWLLNLVSKCWME